MRIISVLFGATLFLAACGSGGGAPGDQGGDATPGDNAAPTADAGADRTAAEFLLVQLAGLADDPDGSITQVLWEQLQGPNVTLQDADTLAASFRAPVFAPSLTLAFRLTVTDDQGATASDDVEVTIAPFHPVAFSARTNGDLANEIYFVQPAGGAPIQLTSGEFRNSTMSDLLPLLSPDRSLTLYIKDEDVGGVSELYVARPDGTEKIKLNGPLQPNGSVTRAQWSPTGARIAFTADATTDGVDELFLVDPDGGNVATVAIPDGTVASQLLWAPDGSRLAFLAGSSSELYTVFPDGTGLTKVSGALVPGGFVSGPQWAPDSAHLSFVADALVDNWFELWVVEPDGSNRESASGGAQAAALNYKWAPDGSAVMYATGTYPNIRLHVASADGTTRDTISGLSAAVNNDMWSPDSSLIAYVSDANASGTFEVFVVAPDGTGLTRVSGNLVAGGSVSTAFQTLQWSPDGSLLSYIADQDTDDVFELYTVRPDGTGNAKRSGTLTAGGNVRAYAWSPNSQALAYAADQDTDELDELFYSSAAGIVKVSGPLPAGDDVGQLAFSQAGDYVIYDSAEELFSCAIDGTFVGSISGPTEPGLGFIAFIVAD